MKTKSLNLMFCSILFFALCQTVGHSALLFFRGGKMYQRTPTAAPMTNASPQEIKKRIYDATHELNAVEKSLNNWGKVSMSEPVFMENNGQFKIVFDDSVSNYVQEAQNNISEASRSALETSLYLGVAAQGEFAPPISAGTAAGSSSTNGSGLTLPSQAENALNTFTPLLTLGSLAPALDKRQALEKGINDKIAEILLKFMANPEAATNQQQKVVFGVVQVTCQPGQETQKGYLADFNASVQYGRLVDSNSIAMNVDDGIEKNEIALPGVFAVLPLIDSRNIDMRNSDRSQIELASALSASFAAKGMNAAAKSLADYVRKRETDTEARDSIPVVTSYTDGSTFGFQIYPSAENPSKSSSKAKSKILEPITFPAVVAIIIDRADYFGQTNADQIRTNFQGGPWDWLITESQTRWIPLKRPWYYMLNHSLYERETRARGIDDANADLEWLSRMKTNPNNVWYYHQYEQLQIACDSLEYTALGVRTERRLPLDFFPPKEVVGNKPAIGDIFPHVVWRDTNTTFTVFVNGVTNAADILGVNIAGLDCAPKSSYLYGSNNVAVSVTLPNIFYNTASTSNTIDFVVLTKQQPITKTLMMSLQGKLAPEAIATVSRDNSGRFLGIDVKPGQNLTEQQLLDAAKGILQTSETPPKTTTILH
jgi:hypothetical protein